MNLERFPGGPYTRAAGCALPAHYAELQALCDALGHAAQAEMDEAIQRGDGLARELAYGKCWRAHRLRPSEQFRFPGIEAFDVELTEPGA